MELPIFRYHPDPLATGSVVPSDAECLCCRQIRGYIYTGPAYAKEELDDLICPWCIASGSAYDRFSVEFVDPSAVGDYGRLDAVPEGVREEVSRRTPSYAAWQQEVWWTHCADAAAFLGPAGKEELDALGDAAWLAVKRATHFSEGDWLQFREQLSREFGPTAYLFRCLHCGQLGATWDSA